MWPPGLSTRTPTNHPAHEIEANCDVSTVAGTIVPRPVESRSGVRPGASATLSNSTDNDVATGASALQAKKLRGLCVCATAAYGNAASRLSEHVPSTGTYAYGGYPDIDALYKEQYLVTVVPGR